MLPLRSCSIVLFDSKTTAQFRFDLSASSSPYRRVPLTAKFADLYLVSESDSKVPLPYVLFISAVYSASCSFRDGFTSFCAVRDAK
jgi:hypothetical protein